MNTKKLLIITAVAVMLVGATNAYAYHEWWDGWFNSGDLEYLGATFEYTEGSVVLEDLKYGSVDSFFVSAISAVITFTCESGIYKDYYIKLWPGASGSKNTGQSGQKEVNPGATWTGFAKFYYGSEILVEFDVVRGTWDTGDEEDGYYFNYPYPIGTPTYSAHWVLSYSTPPGLTGDGGSAGALQE